MIINTFDPDTDAIINPANFVSHIEGFPKTAVVTFDRRVIEILQEKYGAKFGQLLYSGDTLADFDNYDEREWSRNSAREKLFAIALEVAVKAVSMDTQQPLR
jgi:hypothetical protein